MPYDKEKYSLSFLPRSAPLRPWNITPRFVICTHDNWLMLVAEAFFKTRVLNEPLVAYRRHTENASLGSENAHRSTLHRISYRLYLLSHLLRRCGR